MEADKDYSALFTSAIVLYYLFIYIHLSKIDSLTLLSNRQNYYADMRSNSKSITGVVSIDMNDLKILNDKYGHEAGDEALKKVADIMRDYVCKEATVYRVGGDEFMIFFKDATEEEISKNIDLMREKINESGYSCAFGYAMRENGETIEDTIRRSDVKMYEDKAFLKKGRN